MVEEGEEFFAELDQYTGNYFKISIQKCYVKLSLLTPRFLLGKIDIFRHLLTDYVIPTKL